MGCFFGHKWNGCKCERCGKKRNIGHKYVPVEGICLVKCSICGKPRSTGKHIWNGCKCECGATRDEGHDWNGCKCKKCSKKRDEGHNFVPVNESIEECTICGLMRCALPEFAENHNLSLVVEVGDSLNVRLPIKADRCTVNWGDDSNVDEYNIDANLYHSYSKAGSYTITINAEGLSSFNKIYAKVTAIYLKNCPQLEELDCSKTKLTTLSISGCTALMYLNCEHCELTLLDLSNNTQLKRVECSHNQLSKVALDWVFHQLPTHYSSYVTVKSTEVPSVFIVCGNNPGFNSCNKQIAKNKKWLVWGKAMLIGASALTPSRWMEVNY